MEDQGAGLGEFFLLVGVAPTALDRGTPEKARVAERRCLRSLWPGAGDGRSSLHWVRSYQRALGGAAVTTWSACVGSIAHEGCNLLVASSVATH